VINVDVSKLIEWPTNPGCESSSQIEICEKSICATSSLLKITASTKNETIEITLKMKSKDGDDSYERQVIVEKVYST